MSTVQELKEHLCTRIGSVDPANLTVQLLNGGAVLNEAMSLAYYNIADQTQLIFSAKRQN